MGRGRAARASARSPSRCGSTPTCFLQLAGAIALLFSGENAVLMRLEFVAILGLYAGALLRAWEIIGI